MKKRITKDPVKTYSQPIRRTTHLGQRQPVTATKERLRILEQRLDLLHERSNSSLNNTASLIRRSAKQLECIHIELVDERIDKQSNPCSAERASLLIRRRDEVRGILVDQELRDDPRLDDDLAVPL